MVKLVEYLTVSDPKFRLFVAEISVPGLTLKWRKPNTKYSHYEFQLKASFKPIESIGCLFRNVSDPKSYFGFT